MSSQAKRSEVERSILGRFLNCAIAPFEMTMRKYYMNNSKVLKVAVIGVGAMGRNHARSYSSIKGASLVGVADVNERQGRKIAKSYHTKFYAGYLDLIKKEKPQAVSIAVPTSLHYRVAMDCINRGISVLVEKPLTSTVEDAENLVRAAKKRKVVLLAGHIERYNPVVIKLQKLMKEGEFGDILSIVVKRVGLYPPRVSDVNVVTDLAVHDLDIICSLLGKTPTRVYARGGRGMNNKRIDHAEIFLDFDKFSCFIQVNWITPIKIRTLSITGKKGYAEIDYVAQNLDIYKSNNNTSLPSGFQEFISKFGSPRKEQIRLKGEEPLRFELEDFIQSVRSNRPTLVTPEEGVRAVILSQAVLQSITKNKPIPLKYRKK